MAQPTRICFVYLGAYALFYPQNDKIMGGAEVRSGYFARGMAENPQYETHFIVRNHGQAPEKQHNIQIYPHPYYKIRTTWLEKNLGKIGGNLQRTGRFPFLRVKSWQPSLVLSIPFFLAKFIYEVYIGQWFFGQKLLWIKGYRITPIKYRIYEEIDADVYVILGVNLLSAEVIRFCQVFGKRSLLLIAHDADLNPLFKTPSREQDSEGRAAFIAHFVLHNADQIITQTQSQADLLKAHFGRESSHIKNPLDLKLQTPLIPETEREYIFWVGRAVEFKQPWLCIEIAARLPHLQFLMVMNSQDAAIEADVRQRKPDNVTILPYIPTNEIENYYARAIAYLNTSSAEGFPNAFLQAAKYHVPVVALNVNPNDYLTQHDAGFVAGGDLDKAAEALEKLADDRALLKEMGANHRRYAEDQHEWRGRVAEFETLLAAMLDEPESKRDDSN